MTTDTLTKNRWVYSFGGGGADGDASMKNLLGGKGANLAEMCALGLPVPPGFTITTETCVHYYANGRSYPADLEAQVRDGLAKVEKAAGKTFGDPSNPLLVSVRSGARASMPGMMDTVLNLGLNDETVAGLAKLSGDKRFAFDSYRRFIQMYSNVVLDLDHHMFEEILDDHKDRLGVTVDTALSAEDWEGVVADYKQAVERELGRPFPQDPTDQLWGAVGAVFASWMNDRAKFYRRMHDIPESWGTAVNVQSMVFGNMGDTSATGVAFTRNPSTGENRLYGEFLINAQGEDVVAGIRTPQNLTRAAREEMGETAPSMEEAMPEVFAQFKAVVEKLEKHYRDMQDIEFTVERGVLYMLQTRNGKRTAKAALKIAVDMAAEGLIGQDEAVMRVEPAALDQLLHPTIDPKAQRDVIAAGLPASPGAATGKVVFDADEAERLGQAGEAVILVRDETSPEDIHGMHAARGIITARGGMTSHAAVVARGMGRPCVSGAGDVRIDAKAGEFRARGRTFKAGDIITIDGSKGEILAGAVKMVEPELTGDFASLMVWADAARRLKVRANAETPLDAQTARGFGAEGIGLCRTEHMFFDADRIAAVREMILADDEGGRRAALAKILPMQRADFVELFTIMEGLPVTIRLLDPPLHEFLPHTEEDVEAVAKATGLDARKLLLRAKDLQETNPMLGHRGCRLGVSYPEIYEMQVRAIVEAACEIAASGKAAPVPEIMHPLVAKGEEMKFLRELTDRVAKQVIAEKGQAIEYMVGTMVELPRAALRADELAVNAEFFSFGTNDLTQTTFGISRDDAGKFLGAYLEKGIFEKDPFVSLDQDGVGDLIRIAVERGRKARPDVKLGICGEHGGDPASIDFCERAGLDYVSCSPYRVPIARLAAAQAALARR
ncbi:pyruvate, phosphate dikinase [Caulobacter sp. CCUG 60055]|uniref:pyruvate, phosphate dikinase n=1 Tax=Caulobacter sp. CCUG 60055 TaxID=2100090 RepID=UPI001FA801A9|nr:pyruvate, phosphate dikinase [Caulobacter sp. CCUG 60055]MCI3182230.1 pyruvate, phosphate dikinase [Caulobacter sp. CCUG 60055]